MPLSVQVAAPASQGAQMLTASSSSTPASSSGGGEPGERGFSSQLEAEKRGGSDRAEGVRTKPVDKPGESTGKPATAGTGEESVEPEQTRQAPQFDATEKAKARPGSEGNAAPHSLARLDAMANNQGLQNAPAGGLSERAIIVPFATMGERVLSLLAAGADGEGETSTAGEGAVDPLAMIAGGNASPPEDVPLPQSNTETVATESGVDAPLSLELEDVDPELLVAQSEVLPAPVEQAVAQVDAASVAAALGQREALNSDDPEVLPSLSLRSRDAVDVPANPAPASVIRPELSRTLPGKQASVSGMLVEGEPDVAFEVEPDLAFPSVKNIKPLIEGAVSNATVKMPAAQIVAEALSNAAGAKENFEQVRQNIMAAMAGKPELAGPVAALSGGADGGASATQSLSLSSISSTLTAPGTESVKYNATQETAPPRFFTLQVPAGQPGWDVEVGNRIRWMVGQHNQGLELRLNPPELGSIEVKVATEGERTNVTFFAANPAAREALETALPRLREMFSDSGMELANADVSDQSLQQEREQLAESGALVSDSHAGESLILETESGSLPGGQAESRGHIDYYI